MSSRIDSAKRAFLAWEKNCAALAAAGKLEPRTSRNGCGRCGGDIDIRIYLEPFDGHEPVATKAIGVCPVCRVDRVKRWGDLMGQSAAEGRELRRVTPGEPHPGTARILASAGLVSYNRDDGAWELTTEGLALLRRADDKGLAVAIADRARIVTKSASELDEADRRIDGLRKAGAR